jgi:hypothetical protein
METPGLTLIIFDQLDGAFACAAGVASEARFREAGVMRVRSDETQMKQCRLAAA